MKSLYSQHCEKWKDGCGADICVTANRRVFARGCIPCDVLLIGEAPGDSENVLGQPFVGPAGALLNRITTEALAQHPDNEYRLGYYNLLGCIPLDESGHKMKEPPEEAIECCKPRLEEFLTIAQPKLIVRVGKHAKEWLEQGMKHSVVLPDRNTPMIDIVHPAHILRAPIASQSLLKKQCIVRISTALMELERASTLQTG